jgi:hypothetical protein
MRRDESGNLPVIAATLVGVDPHETLDLALCDLLTLNYLFHCHPVLNRRIGAVKLIHSDDRKNVFLISHRVRSTLTTHITGAAPITPDM